MVKTHLIRILKFYTQSNSEMFVWQGVIWVYIGHVWKRPVEKTTVAKTH